MQQAENGPDRVKTRQAMAVNCRGIFSASRRPPEAQSGAFGDSGCYGTLGFGAPAGGRQNRKSGLRPQAFIAAIRAPLPSKFNTRLRL